MLSAFYSKSIEQAKAGLTKRFKFSIADPKDTEIELIAKNLPLTCSPCSNYWKIEIPVPDLKGSISLIIAVPDRFPDYFPKIYLSEADFRRIWPIPHLEENKAICTRSDDSVVLSDLQPDFALEKLINIAIDTIVRGVKKENIGDYEDEYLAYWNEKAEFKSELLSLITPIDDPAFCKLFRVKPPLFGSESIIADSKESLERWLMPLGIESLQCLDTILYLPVENYLSLSFNKNVEILEFFKESVSTTGMRFLQDYFSMNLSFYILVCSRLFKGKRVMFAFRIDGWQDITIKGFSRKKNIQLDFLLSYYKLKNKTIRRMRLSRLDRDFIFSRVRYD